MGLNQVQYQAPRPVDHFGQRGPEPTWQEKLLQGLQIANSISGIYSNVETGKKNSVESDSIAAKADRAANNVPEADTLTDFAAKNGRQVPVGTPGSVLSAHIAGLDENGKPKYEPIGLLGAVKEAPAPKIEILYGMGPKGEKIPMEHVMGTPFPKDFKAYTEPKTDSVMSVETTGPDGKPVTAIVPKTAGTSYPKPDSTSKTAKLPAGEAQQIGVYQTGIDQLDALQGEWKSKTGTFSGVTKFLPNTDASKYGDASDLAAQNIGQILEGGKLAEGDISRYKDMMPTAGDSPERAQEKFDRLRIALESKRNNSIKGAQQAGYDVSGFPEKVNPRDPKLDLIPKKTSSSGTAANVDARKAAAVKIEVPKIGDVQDGWIFKGGDPSKQENWGKE